MDEEAKNYNMHTKSDEKPEAPSTSQTDPSARSSVCDELREPCIPPARFWALCVGYVTVTALHICLLLTYTTKSISRPLSSHD